MKIVFKYYLLCALTSFLLAVPGYSSADNVASAYVPVEDAVYDFLDNCSARGLLPVGEISSRPLSRAVIGRILMQLTVDYQKFKDSILQDDLNYYLSEFALDISISRETLEQNSRTLRQVGYNPDKFLNEPHWHVTSFNTENNSFIFDPLISFRYDMTDDNCITRRATGIQFRGDYHRKFGYYFRFVDHVERGGGRSISNPRSQLIDDRWGYVEAQKPDGKEVYYDMTEAYITTRLAGIDFLFGKDRIRWGPAKEGGLLLSGISPSFSQLRTSVRLWDKVRFIHTVGALHPTDLPLDTLYVTDNGWTRTAHSWKWLAAHRIEYNPCEFLTVAVNEAVIWGERGLDFSYVNPVNFYYSAEHNGGDNDNVLMSGDFCLRVGKLGLLYGELLIDDMNTSTLGKGDPGNKFGYLLGFAVYKIGFDGAKAGVEYTRLDPYLYTHFYPINRYSTWTSSLGSNIGSNSDRLRGWFSYRPMRNLEFTLKADYNRSGTVGSDPNTSVNRRNPGSAYFLEGIKDEWIATEASISYEVLTGIYINTGWVNGDKRTSISNRFYLGTGYRY
ncbi:capsule assembly Wzi family protein [bacterium]|nr:capsule assembly Wzi family protein [bacterium]